MAPNNLNKNLNFLKLIPPGLLSRGVPKTMPKTIICDAFFSWMESWDPLPMNRAADVIAY